MHPILETQRLMLRPFALEDAPSFMELNADPEVMQYTGDSPFATVQDAEDLIRNYRQYADYQLGRLTMQHRHTGELLGWCGLKYLAEQDEVDLGYRLHRRYWNQGYATEASQACLDYGFNIKGLDYIIARADPQNVASTRVMQKLGMRLWREEQQTHQHPLAVVVYRLDNPKPAAQLNLPPWH